MERGTSRRITYVGFLLAILLLIMAGVVTYRSQQVYQETVSRESHTYVVMETATEFLNHLLQGESSTRAYVLTGDTAQKNDGLEALTRAGPLLDSLLTLTIDKRARARLAKLVPIAAHRIALIRELSASRDSTTGIPRRMLTIVTNGDAVMHKLRREMAGFKNEELRLLEDRAVAADRSGDRALLAAMGAVGLALLILLAAISTTFQELRERERVEDELQHESERQAVMIEMQQAIATAPVGDLLVLDLIVEQAMQLTGADAAMLNVIDGDHYIARTVRGNVAGWHGRRMPLERSIIGWVAAHREATMIPDTLADPRVDQTLVSQLGNRSLVVLPIIDGERTVGVLLIGALRTDAFTPREFTVLKIMAGILSAGLTNVSAFEANERLLAELRQSRDTAEQANRAKSDFLATMSHELRTPLNSVIGFANLMLRNRTGNLTDQDLQYLGRIRDNGTHLLGLINDILDVSKIEAGMMEVRPEPTDLAPLIRETVAQLGGQATGRPVEIHAEAADGLLPVEVDPARLKQVLINLIGNGVKFTERGSVTVRLVADGARRPLRIDVTDTGIGIPPDRLEAIFEAFTQAEATTERRFGGSGLGLTISRSLLRLMGADLSVTSTVGKGSTFSITFLHEGTRSEREGLAPGQAAGGTEILVVDDDVHTRQLLSALLGAEGYVVRTARNGQEALGMLKGSAPALILLDLRMPVMDGVRFLEALRQDPRQSALPVVIVTSLDSDSVEVRSLGPSVKGVLQKGPALERSLHEVLREVLGG